MSAVDTDPIRVFLEPHHPSFAQAASAFAAEELKDRPEPATDSDARAEARALALAMGSAGLFAPILEGDLRAACLAREAVAWGSPLADGVWALQALGLTPVLRAGSEDQRRAWSEPVAEGRALGAFAMTEPAAGSDVAAMESRAVRKGDGWVLDGAKHLISNAGIADFYAVFAATSPEAGSRGISCFLVPADAPGLTYAGPQEMSARHPLGRIELRDCRVPADALLGEENRGFMLGMATLDRLRPTVGAAACGMARRALDEAAAHALDRRQFGRPLAEFQLVKAKLGRMAIALEAARLLVYRAAWEADRGAERITVPAAAAKAFATEAAQRIVDDAVQIVGGIGVLADHPVERLYRAVRALRIYEGTTDIQRLIVADALLKDAEERPAS
ncbi:MAG TPA: acyl-CoA dehydrogenase family protein [Longimicrobiales bacterium]|nr:acyl-CoA dehydrogenase family protein [Longimicrobiales bacterium]